MDHFNENSSEKLLAIFAKETQYRCLIIWSPVRLG